MGPVNGFTTTPHHRQNRRRERPGSRTRRTITRKSNVQFDCAEGLEYARDTSVPLPSDITRPSPLLRQNFDQSWQRWKAREAEERTLAEMDKMQLEQEQQRLFGGEVDDDELRRMGILYVGEDIAVDSESNTIVCGVPVESSGPMFSIRQGKPRRSRRSTWRSLPLYLSFSDLSNDADIARLLSFSTPPTPTIQHRPLTIQTHTDTDIDIPQSLPPTPAFTGSLLPHLVDNTPISNLDSTLSRTLRSANTILPNTGDWTVITTPHNTPGTLTPLSEPETWILIDDL